MAGSPGSKGGSAAAAEEKEFSLTLRLDEGYRMDIAFDGEKMADILADEPEPLGESEGPNAARLLGAAVGNCLSASLLFCLRKARVDVRGLQTEVTGRITRSERGRFRIAGVSARIAAAIPPEDQSRVSRCLEVFEDFCIVSASVRDGIQVDVEVDVVDPARAGGG
ncbi:MAG TPA: OsmC family protein [Longimicrobiales bacterium]|nr:OsmC family protein [Longimicrobiales bacterium]